jgi:polysaccharide chain length determinant protein (PEP-CTERM system associated)
MNAQQGFQLSDFSGILRRRGKAMAIVAGAVMLAMYWLAMALPNQYASYATILVEPQAIDQQLIRAGVGRTDLKERLGIMTAQILSRGRLSKMIDQLGLYPEESETMVRQEVIGLMRGHVNVEPVISELEADQRNKRELDFNTFKISYRSDNANTASVVAQSIANDFLDANIKARVEVSQQSLDFMDDSIKSLSQRLIEVEAKIKAVKAENAGQLPEDMKTNQEMLQAMVTRIREAQRGLDVARSDEAFWKNQAITAASMTSPNDVASPGYRMKLLETELGAMKGKGYTDRHPDVIQARQELEVLKARVANAGSDDDSSDSFAEQNAKSEQRRAALRVKATQEEIQRVQAQLEGVQGRIAATPAVAEQLDGLNREYEHLSASFQDFNARRQQAIVQANLERKQLGEQFRILESAYPALRPSSPNRMMILALGVILGIGLGAAIGLVLEGADSSLHQPKDLQQATNLPVLATIPAIMLEPDRVARTRKMVRELVLAGAVVLFCLLGGLATYVLVNGAPGGAIEEEEAPGEQARFDYQTRVGEGVAS